MAYVLLGAAVDGRIYQIPRLLQLTQPIGVLSSDTLRVAYNPVTQADWTVSGIKTDPEWLSKGNPDENGQTNGYDFQKLRDGEPLSENNFILTDVPGNDFNLVSKWLRSKLPTNDGAGEGETWLFRPGVVFNVSPIGTLPDSNADSLGNYPQMNQTNWLRIDVWEARFPDFERWFHSYIVTDEDADPAQVCYIEDQFASNTKVGRTGTPTPMYEYPVGSPVLALVDPEYVDAGDVQWIRLQR